MAWTVADIKQRVRDLTGRPETSQLSDADLLEYINDFYVYVLPQVVDLRDLETTWTKASSDESFTIDVDIVDLNRPAYIDGSEIPLYTDKNHFFDRYTYTGGSTGTPAAALLYARKVYLRPEPSGSVSFVAFCTQLPTAFTDNANTPTDIKWGPLISYGTAVEILKKSGQTAEATELMDMYMYHVNSITKKQQDQDHAGDAPPQAPPER